MVLCRRGRELLGRIPSSLIFPLSATWCAMKPPAFCSTRGTGGQEPTSKAGWGEGGGG